MNCRKLLIIGRESKLTELLVNCLSLNHEVICVVYERKESDYVKLKRRIKKIGVLKVLDQLLFIVIVAKCLKLFSQKRISEILETIDTNADGINSSKVINVESVNSNHTISLLKSFSYDLIILSGTRILSKNFLNSVGGKIVNLHTGITPNYRGVHGAYWAYVNRQQNLAGVTLHYVDSGVDTGNIIDQELINVSSKDNFSTYSYIQKISGIGMLLNFLNNDELTSFKGKIFGDLGVSKQYYHPGGIEYLYYRFIRGVK